MSRLKKYEKKDVLRCRVDSKMYNFLISQLGVNDTMSGLIRSIIFKYYLSKGVNIYETDDT